MITCSLDTGWWIDALDVLIYSLAASSPTFAQPPLAALARLRQRPSPPRWATSR
jgi:hypothetical protein